jgi:hypothetical protein
MSIAKFENQEDKHIVKTFIDALLTKKQLQQLAQ